MRKIKYTLILTLILSNLSFAQDMLIKTNGDTLVGRLTYGVDSFDKEYVIVRVNRKKDRVKILEIRQIKTAKGDIIKPVAVAGNYRLGKVIVSGFMSYSKVTNPNSSERYTADLLHKMDGKSALFEGKIGFKTRAREFVADCAKLSDAINNKEYRIGDLARITEEYNSCIESNNNSSSVEQSIAKVEKQALSKNLEQKLADFSTLLQYSDRVSNKTDVTAMFNDLSGKLRRKESVPGYLKTALENALKSDPQLTKLLKEILGTK